VTTETADECRILPKPRLGELIDLLWGDGFEVIGPRIDQGAIVYGPVRTVADLPIGWTDRQEAGSYRLEPRSDGAFFGFAVGPHSWKKYLFPPMLRLWEAAKTDDGFVVSNLEPNVPRRAFLAVRSCELHALAIQDRVFIDHSGRFTDPHYAEARARLFLIAVECEHPGGTCFCTSMGTGPSVDPDRIPLDAAKHDDAARQANSGNWAAPAQPRDAAGVESEKHAPVCDLIFTELDDAFVVKAVSEAGRGVAIRLGLVPASLEQVAEGRRRVDSAAQSMGRTLNVVDIKHMLQRNQEHPRWDDVAERCLACTNCTMVCPTCFCSATEDVADLSLEQAARVRRWDSCFNPEFARVHGGNFRASVRGRYRQWLTHKFASWFDQFDLSGCVGCGRCITWCPVGIDVTEEITAIRATGAGAGAERHE
jgi:ferredoxin